MHSNSDIANKMISDKANEVIKKLFEPLLFINQIGLETTMKGSILFFEFTDLLHYKCHKINLSYGGSYINSSFWIKSKNSN